MEKCPRFGVRLWVLVAAALVALGLTLVLGLYGFGRPGGESHLDFLAYYGAGCRLLEHQSPYGLDPETPRRMAEQGHQMRVFAYAPNMSPLVMWLASLTYRQATVVFSVMTVIAVVAFGIGAALLALGSRWENPKALPARQAMDEHSLLRATLVLVIAWAPPYASHSLWLGNIAALSMACVVWAWWLDARGHPVLAGVLFGIAALKPPSVILAGFWLLLERRWIVLAVSAAVVALMSLPMMRELGAWGAWAAWLHGMQSYAATPENQPTGEFVIGLRSVLVSLGISAPDLSVLGVLFVLGMWRSMRPLSPVSTLSLTVTATMIFFHGHMLALLWLAVIAGSFLEIAGTEKRPLTITGIAIAVFLMPRIALRAVHAPDWLMRYRTIELIVTAGAMFYVMARKKREGDLASSRAPSAIPVTEERIH